MSNPLPRIEAVQERLQLPVSWYVDPTMHALGRDDRGPYQEPLEDGMVHFHRWLRAKVEPHL